MEIADITTDEAADQTEINQAFANFLPRGPTTQNATVTLAAGQYAISGLVTVTGFATLTGTGRGSNILPDEAGLEIALETGAELSHLSFVSQP